MPSFSDGEFKGWLLFKVLALKIGRFTGETLKAVSIILSYDKSSLHRRKSYLSMITGAAQTQSFPLLFYNVPGTVMSSIRSSGIISCTASIWHQSFRVVTRTSLAPAKFYCWSSLAAILAVSEGRVSAVWSNKRTLDRAGVCECLIRMRIS